jgi:hypothetical protein
MSALKSVMFEALTQGTISDMMSTIHLGMEHPEYNIRVAAQLVSEEVDTIVEASAVIDNPRLVQLLELYASVVSKTIENKL